MVGKTKHPLLDCQKHQCSDRTSSFDFIPVSFRTRQLVTHPSLGASRHPPPPPARQRRRGASQWWI